MVDHCEMDHNLLMPVGASERRIHRLHRRAHRNPSIRIVHTHSQHDLLDVEYSQMDMKRTPAYVQF